MTTGRINQVACRAARTPRTEHGARTTRSATDRATSRRATRAPYRLRRSGRKRARAHRSALAAARACAVYKLGLGSHARRTSQKEGPERAPPEPDEPRTTESAQQGRSAHRESTPSRVAPAGHARRTAHWRRTRWRAEHAPHRQARVVKPERLGECRTTNAQSDTPAAAAREPWCAGPSDARTRPERRGRATDARCTRWLAPDACDESRNRSHNSEMLRHARTGTRTPDNHPENRSSAERRDRCARPPQLPRHKATRCRAPRASSCPEGAPHDAPEAGRVSVGREGHAAEPQASQLLPRAACLARALPGKLSRETQNAPTRAFPPKYPATRQPSSNAHTATRDETRRTPILTACCSRRTPASLYGAPRRWYGRPACPPAARRPPPASHRPPPPPPPTRGGRATARARAGRLIARRAGIIFAHHLRTSSPPSPRRAVIS